MNFLWRLSRWANLSVQLKFHGLFCYLSFWCEVRDVMSWCVFLGCFLCNFRLFFLSLGHSRSTLSPFTFLCIVVVLWPNSGTADSTLFWFTWRVECQKSVVGVILWTVHLIRPVTLPTLSKLRIPFLGRYKMMDEGSVGSAAKVGLGEVRVRVKSASHRCEDIEISCPLDSNVRQVKQLIKEQYPLHPVSQQITCIARCVRTYTPVVHSTRLTFNVKMSWSRLSHIPHPIHRFWSLEFSGLVL